MRKVPRETYNEGSEENYEKSKVRKVITACTILK
jgi:hypothetical protein